ncbi:MAG: DUF1049 domain-containing protein, partial [Mesorhizobium sp.]
RGIEAENLRQAVSRAPAAPKGPALPKPSN